MVLTLRMQNLLLNVDGKKGVCEVLGKIYSDRGYGYFCLNVLMKLGLLSFRKEKRKKIYSLTSVGQQLKDILSNLPEVSHEWYSNSNEAHTKTLKRKNARFLNS